MFRSTLISLATVASALTFASPAALAEDAAKTSLTLTIDTISKEQGTLMIGLFKGEEGYTSDDAVGGLSPVVEGDTVTVTFSDLEPGEYGIKMYHDANDDGKMNTNPFGMPTEAFAFSNNAPARFGPPSWDAAKFTVSADATEHTISLYK